MDLRDARALELAAQPLRTAGTRPGVFRGFGHSVKDIWAHRELLDLLIKREVKARYKDSALGFVWSLMRPLAMLLIYYIALGKFLGAARDIPDFAIFIYTGLTAWGLFSEAVSTGTASIVQNAGLVKKVYLPREIFPLASMGSALFNFAIQLGILVVATIAVGNFPAGTRWGYLPLSLAVIVVTALGWSLLLSAINVYLRDIQYLVEIAIMIAFWASPIVYSWALVQGELSGTLQQLYLTNPMTAAIMGFQQTFWVAGDGQPVPDDLTGMLWAWLGIGIVFTFVAQRVFARLQGNFAQEL
ncbi:ABC transporter permease [Cellulomonas sp. PS-H5]|uniref:ABC transporter permease n=1 Tax=Cellulomonas sp. PS-H5 TaxID=2820400 RepID=UPI001C4FF29C|nr:ABC transporter permease [Cellulomonas sp. PS-H5]MBW0254627.1 ABC transporter permease [Cellulomonas sp. PS-H5]